MVQAALLLLMLEAVFTDLVFTISPKRSTPNFSDIHKLPADYPIFRGKSGRAADIAGTTEFGPNCDIGRPILL
jgi:hypothetical protein